MNIFVNILGSSNCIEVGEEERIERALEVLQLPKECRVHHNGRIIHATDRSFKDLRIQDRSTLTLTLPLKGGAAKCHLASCTERVARLTGTCRWCESEFCSRHRLPESHECTNMNGCRQQSQQKNSDKLMNGKCVADKV